MFNWFARLATEMKADKVIGFLFDDDCLDLVSDLDLVFGLDLEWEFCLELTEAGNTQECENTLA